MWVGGGWVNLLKKEHLWEKSSFRCWIKFWKSDVKASLKQKQIKELVVFL